MVLMMADSPQRHRQCVLLGNQCPSGRRFFGRGYFSTDCIGLRCKTGVIMLGIR